LLFPNAYLSWRVLASRVERIPGMMTGAGAKRTWCGAWGENLREQRTLKGENPPKLETFPTICVYERENFTTKTFIANKKRHHKYSLLTAGAKILHSVTKWVEPIAYILFHFHKLNYRNSGNPLTIDLSCYIWEWSTTVSNCRPRCHLVW
jgi:hypothetical protein